MWSSSASGRNNNNNSNGVSSSPSKSSSTCSSPSPFSPSSPATNTSNRTSMEEVWKDISLSSLHDHSSTTTTTTTTATTTTATTTTTTNHSNFPGLIFQDFLARPFNKDPPTKVASTEPSSLGDLTSFGSLRSSLATTLSLNSGSDFQYLESGATAATRPNQHLRNRPCIDACSFGSSQNSSFDALGSPSIFPTFCKKRPQENDDNSDDRRHKRMIKNRESAARSRARKQETFSPLFPSYQAYTNELELEVAHLLEENAKLRKEQEKLWAAAAQLPKKRTLYRTATAPF